MWIVFSDTLTGFYSCPCFCNEISLTNEWTVATNEYCCAGFNVDSKLIRCRCSYFLSDKL